ESYSARRHRPSLPTRRSSDLTTGSPDRHPQEQARRRGRPGDPAPPPPPLRETTRRAWPAAPGSTPRLGASPRSTGATSRPPCGRSEEHTSELQSRENLVCRLL